MGTLAVSFYEIENTLGQDGDLSFGPVEFEVLGSL